jgi:hypothetical protein
VCSRAEYTDLRVGAEVEALIEAFGDVALRHFAARIADRCPERRSAVQQSARVS